MSKTHASKLFQSPHTLTVIAKPMKKKYRRIRDIWNSELNLLHKKPEIWISEAHGLRNSAELLYRYEGLLMPGKSRLPDELKLTAFFPGRIIRMLMGFSIENLLKGIIFQNKDERRKILRKEGNIKWEAKKSHDLNFLSKLADIELTESEQENIHIWQVCAIWAGRYPTPINEQELPKQRVPAKSSEELMMRRNKEIAEAMKAGNRIKPEIWDLLHSGVGTLEFEGFISLYDKLKKSLERPGDNTR